MLKSIVKNTFDILIKKCGIPSHFVRTLYGSSALGIDGYIQTREKIQSQFTNNIETFKQKMCNYIDDKPKTMIFTEDLKNMIHLVEKTSEDLDLAVKMMKKFNNQNKELRFGNFIFGPVVMRMFYYFGDCDRALEAFKSPELVGFFDQLVSFQILMDLLYENGRYQDILNIFDVIKTRQIQDGKYPKHAVVLVCGACYKLNTKESFDYCMNLWRELSTVGHNPMRKAACFAAGLALHQNSPHIALEILSTIKDQQYITVRNIKAQAYAEVGRPEDALPILRSILEIDDPTNKKYTFIKDVIDKVRISIETNNKKELESDFNRISKYLNDNGHITNESLNDILCTEITSTGYSAQRRDRSMVAASFSKDNYRQKNTMVKNKFRARQGLEDLY